jgi:RNA polymerase sigma-70 factor (ECF subfamily)
LKLGFETTRWSRVLAARRDDTEGRRALASLCEDYWYPLYFFCRRRGYGADEASDLTQAYFAKLIEKGYLAQVDPSAGRFRSFLLTSFKNFLANEYDKARAQKRGGQVQILSLETEAAEGRWQREPADELTPEEAYERRWAATVVERTLARLERESERRGRSALFAGARPFLTGDSNAGPYTATAAALGMSDGALRTAVHRLRERFGTLLRQEIVQTVPSRSDVDDEIRYLLGRLRP